MLAYEAIHGALARPRRRRRTSPTTSWRASGQQIAVLRGHRIAHRDLRLANLFLDDDGDVWLIDFGFAELAASDLLLATDLAELLTSLSLLVGPAAGGGPPGRRSDRDDFAPRSPGCTSSSSAAPPAPP